MGPILQARGLGRRYGRQWALQGIDLEIARGKITALLGPNGAGKSTLLRILATLDRADRGELAFDGVTLPESRAALRRSLGFVGHEGLVDDALTALENLEFHADLHNLSHSRDDLEAALRRVGLGERIHDRVSTFSRGMRQRLSLARALLAEPRLLLLDEAGSGLDAAGLRWLAETLEAARSSGASVVLATHQLSSFLPLCDEIVLLSGGKIHHRGSFDEGGLSAWESRIRELSS